MIQLVRGRRTCSPQMVVKIQVVLSPARKRGDNRTFKKTLETGCDTIPCYIPKYGDMSDVHLPWAYASIVDPRYFPKGANLEQVDVMQLGKSVNFCVAPFDGAPLCRIGDDRSVFATKDQQTSYLTTYAGSFDTKSAIAEEVLSGATKVDGSTLMQSLTTGTTTYSHLTPRERNDAWASWR